MSRLYVCNVSSKGSIEELQSLFEECGKLKVFGLKDKDDSGYIEYLTPEEAENAIKKLHGKTFYDKELTVEPSRLKNTINQSSKNNRNYKYRNHYRTYSNKRRSSSSFSNHSHRRRNYKDRSKSRSRSSSRSKSRSRSRDGKRSHHHRRHHSRHYKDSRSD